MRTCCSPIARAKDGQILEEGITEAGSMSSFIAAGTAYATYGMPTIPFFIYYSMFGFQRIGDLIWALADAGQGLPDRRHGGPHHAAGEGLQHQDGHSHRAAPRSRRPSLRSGVRLRAAIIVQDGIRRMYEEGRGPLLLHHAVQRELPDAGDAERHHEGILLAASIVDPEEKWKRR